MRSYQIPRLTTANDITEYRVRRNHTVRSTHGCQLSSEHGHFRGKLRPADESSDEMWTKTSRILVLVSVIWSNFRHSFSFINEN